jgi:hypothetical protein
MMPVPPSDTTQTPEIDPHALSVRFYENRGKFPAEELAPYAGQMVAWWPDGSRIFDADANYQALFRRVRDAGYADSFFVFEPIPLPGQTEIDPYVALRMKFADNRDNFPYDELVKHAGKLVAWWPDGSRIVDSDFDDAALIQRLRESGYDSSFLVLERLRSPSEGYI